MAEWDAAPYGGGPLDDTQLDRAAVETRVKSFIRTPGTQQRTKALFIVIPSGLLFVYGLISVAPVFSTDGGPAAIPAALLGLIALIVAARYGYRGLKMLAEFRSAYDRAEPKPSISTVRKRLTGSFKQVRGIVDGAVGVLPKSVVYGPVHLVGPALPAYGFLDGDG